MHVSFVEVGTRVKFFHHLSTGRCLITFTWSVWLILIEISNGALGCVLLIIRNGKPNSEFVCLCNFKVSGTSGSKRSNDVINPVHLLYSTPCWFHLQGGSCQVVVPSNRRHTSSPFLVFKKYLFISLAAPGLSCGTRAGFSLLRAGSLLAARGLLV